MLLKKVLIVCVCACVYVFGSLQPSIKEAVMLGKLHRYFSSCNPLSIYNEKHCRYSGAFISFYDCDK